MPSQTSTRKPVLLLLGLALAAAAPGQARALADRAAAIDGPRLGAAVTLDGPLSVGRGEIAPAAGTRAYRLLAQGRAAAAELGPGISLYLASRLAGDYSFSTILIMSCWLPSGSVPYCGMV